MGEPIGDTITGIGRECLGAGGTDQPGADCAEDSGSALRDQRGTEAAADEPAVLWSGQEGDLHHQRLCQRGQKHNGIEPVPVHCGDGEACTAGGRRSTAVCVEAADHEWQIQI